MVGGGVAAGDFVSLAGGVSILSYSNGSAGVGGNHTGVRGDLMSPSRSKLTYRASRIVVLMLSITKTTKLVIQHWQVLVEQIRTKHAEWMKGYSGPLAVTGSGCVGGLHWVCLVFHCQKPHKGNASGQNENASRYV